jgi:hypothetical protein
MKFAFYLVLLGFGMGSCYDMADVGLNAAYLQSNQTANAAADQSQDRQTDPGYQPRDTVYLKDGSIIHGFIVEEQPGVSLQIKTKAGNIYTYQMADVAKITHVAQTNGDNSNAENNDNGATSNNSDTSSDSQK